jgi:hypothetical protein
MRNYVPLLIVSFLILSSAPNIAKTNLASSQSWEMAKASQIPRTALPDIFEAPEKLDIATMAWEDGLYISRNGHELYCTYIPFDMFSAAVANHTPPQQWHLYLRGPSIGQDFTNPFKASYPWLHADIAIATRSSTSQPFSSWHLTNQKTTSFNKGGAQGIQTPGSSQRFDYFVYTDDSKTHLAIMMLTNTDATLSGVGKRLPLNVNNPNYNQDNPHIERSDSRDPRKLVLFFDSDNRPGAGARDIWYTQSLDRGATWSDPKQVSLDSAEDEEQPHLYFDNSQWWLYFSATNPKTKALEIYRAKQTIAGNWERWQNKELVISAGSAVAVGEPSLTQNGDVSFVAITQNPSGTPEDKYDCDPWIMKRKVPSH